MLRVGYESNGYYGASNARYAEYGIDVDRIDALIKIVMISFWFVFGDDTTARL